jgi:hypothetical protein
VRDELTHDGPTCGKRELVSLVRPVVGPTFQLASQTLQELFWRLQSKDAGFHWLAARIEAGEPKMANQLKIAIVQAIL